MNKAVNSKVNSSFRDPNGFLYFSDGILYRQINIQYADNYDLLINSGLYEKLKKSRMLISHKEVKLNLNNSDKAYKIIQPELIPFISYPYEWCFSQLKDAALLTLKTQRIAIEHGMSLKDSSNYNVQFYLGRPIFIDTLSFERYQEGTPWVAYKQFCEHFLSPLLLMKYVDPRLNNMLRDYIDGVPLEITAKILPFSTLFNFKLLAHIHLHARSKKQYAGKFVDKKKQTFGKLSMLGFIDTLESTIRKLHWIPEGTEWGEYYSDTNYSLGSHESKKTIVNNFIDSLEPNIVWDIGANDGTFSRIASQKGIKTISFDIDPASIEKNYLAVKKNGETNILPLIMDLTNPSPALGWCNQERMSLPPRGPCDTLLALALIHHLAISNNVPLSMISDYMCGLCDSLIIEWVPKDDSQVERLLSTREDIFDNYNKATFEHEFARNFNIIKFKNIPETKRILYMMKRK